mgnify:CR=1 FL=1
MGAGPEWARELAERLRADPRDAGGRAFFVRLAVTLGEGGNLVRRLGSPVAQTPDRLQSLLQ